MPMRSATALTALIVFVSLVRPVSADPITITGGTLTIGGFARGDFNSVNFALTGESGLVISGNQSDGVFTRFSLRCAFEPCVAGATTGPGGSFSFVDAAGSTTSAGTNFGFTLTSGSATITSGTVTIPDSTAATLALSSPFSFTGTFGVDTVVDARVRVATLDLRGEGTATTRLRRSGDAYVLEGFSYTFAGATPTPEPASLVLLASGAAWLVRRVRSAGRIPACPD